MTQNDSQITTIRLLQRSQNAPIKNETLLYTPSFWTPPKKLREGTIIGMSTFFNVLSCFNILVESSTKHHARSRQKPFFLTTVCLRQNGCQDTIHASSCQTLRTYYHTSPLWSRVWPAVCKFCASVLLYCAIVSLQEYPEGTKLPF